MIGINTDHYLSCSGTDIWTKRQRESRRFGWSSETATAKHRQTITLQHNTATGIRVFTLKCLSRTRQRQGITSDSFQIPTEKSLNQRFLLRRVCPYVRTWLEICYLQTPEPRRDLKDGARSWSIAFTQSGPKFGVGLYR